MDKARKDFDKVLKLYNLVIIITLLTTFLPNKYEILQFLLLVIAAIVTLICSIMMFRLCRKHKLSLKEVFEKYITKL
ncbi:hypothetical protein ACERC8_00045 [Streptococcus sp. E29BA]|uniref:hypothetical protein n=1 Tax=Streptococcus sp. E29BA TaxID=3278716 RepID=UPI00359F0628